MNFKGSHRFQDSPAKVSSRHSQIGRLSDRADLFSSRAIYAIFLGYSLTEAQLCDLFLKHSNGSESRWGGGKGEAEKVANVNKKTGNTKVEGRNPWLIPTRYMIIATKSQREIQQALHLKTTAIVTEYHND